MGYPKNDELWDRSLVANAFLYPICEWCDPFNVGSGVFTVSIHERELRDRFLDQRAKLRTTVVPAFQRRLPETELVFLIIIDVFCLMYAIRCSASAVPQHVSATREGHRSLSNRAYIQADAPSEMPGRLS